MCECISKSEAWKQSNKHAYHSYHKDFSTLLLVVSLSFATKEFHIPHQPLISISFLSFNNKLNKSLKIHYKNQVYVTKPLSSIVDSYLNNK